MRSATTLPVTVLVSLLGLASAARAENEDAVSIWKGKKSATTEGRVELDAPPSKVYAAATDYKHWLYLFSDVRAVTVESGGAEDAVVKMKSAALGHTVKIRFQNTKDTTISFKLVDGPHGARAWGVYELTPAGDGKRTIVSATLYVDVTGIAGWFITDSSIRAKRQNKLLSDLRDLAKRFPIPASE